MRRVGTLQNFRKVDISIQNLWTGKEHLNNTKKELSPA